MSFLELGPFPRCARAHPGTHWTLRTLPSEQEQDRVRPWRASQGGNASRVSLSLTQPPWGPWGRPNASSEALSGCTPGPPRVGLRQGPVTQGSVRQRQDVRAIHWATRNLALLFIGSAMTGPAWLEEVAAPAIEPGEWGSDSGTRTCHSLCLPRVTSRFRLAFHFRVTTAGQASSVTLYGHGTQQLSSKIRVLSGRYGYHDHEPRLLVLRKLRSVRRAVVEVLQSSRSS